MQKPCIRKFSLQYREHRSRKSAPRAWNPCQHDTGAKTIQEFPSNQKISCKHCQCRPYILPISPCQSEGILYDLYCCSSHYFIIFFGHFSAHFPQFVHFSGSMCAMLSTTLIASNSHTFSHILQPIHPTEHTLITSFPLSLELHCTWCF